MLKKLDFVTNVGTLRLIHGVSCCLCVAQNPKDSTKARLSMLKLQQDLVVRFQSARIAKRLHEQVTCDLCVPERVVWCDALFLSPA